MEVEGNAERPEVVELGALRRGPSMGWFRWEEGEERWECDEPNQSSWDCRNKMVISILFCRLLGAAVVLTSRGMMSGRVNIVNQTQKLFIGAIGDYSLDWMSRQ